MTAIEWQRVAIARGHHRNVGRGFEGSTERPCMSDWRKSLADHQDCLATLAGMGSA